MQISIVDLKHCMGWVLLGLLPIAAVYYLPFNLNAIRSMVIGIVLGGIVVAGFRLVVCKG